MTSWRASSLKSKRLDRASSLQIYHCWKIASSSGGLGPNFGYAINSSCILDGTPTDCSLALVMLAHGVAEQCPKNYCGASPVRNSSTGQIELVPLTRDPVTGFLGYSSSNSGKPPKFRGPAPNPRPGNHNPFGLSGGEEETIHECRRKLAAVARVSSSLPTVSF